MVLSPIIVVGYLFAQPPPQIAVQNQLPSSSKVSAVETESLQKLTSAKRIYVESFGEDKISKTLQAMIVDSFGNNKRFIITENKDKADLFLKGSALERSSKEAHSLSSATIVDLVTGISDSQTSVETVNEARLSVRLVARDGDVVWSTTQESRGAKYKGATADVADKVVKQLMKDLGKVEDKK